MTNNKFNNAPFDKMMFVRIIVLFVALVNQILVSYGYKPLPFDDVQVEQGVSWAVTVGAIIWATWKDNDMTYKARRRTKYNKDKGLK